MIINTSIVPSCQAGHQSAGWWQMLSQGIKSDNSHQFVIGDNVQ